MRDAIVRVPIERERIAVETFPATNSRRTKITLRPGYGLKAIDVAELYRFRDLFRALASRDIKLRYRQTAVGVAWVIFQPLVSAGILTIVFALFAEMPSSGRPQFAVTLVGTLAWQLFASTLSKCSVSMVGNAQLISKVYFPRLILPLSTLGSTFVDFAVSLVVVLGIQSYLALWPGWAMLTLPLWAALLLTIALGIGLASAALTVSYRDVQFVLPVLIPLLMYASPVAYAVAQVPGRYRSILYALNPLASVVEGFRWALLGGQAPPAWAVGLSSLIGLACFGAGVVVFKRMERRFADVI